MSKKGKILCIDDTPDAPEINGQTLKEILSKIYASSPYRIIFETDGEKGIEAVRADNDIKLVLLDVEFKRQKKQGDTLADNLSELNPHVKVIVLTRKDERGNKISFGRKDNVVHYVLKKELDSPYIQECLKNLSFAVIEDYYNRTWELEYREGNKGDVIYLNNPIRLKNYPISSFSINISDEYLEAIRECIQSPNEPINISGIVPEDRQSKIVHDINKEVCEKTNWHTWGLLTREGCGMAHIRLLIDNVTLKPPISRGDIPYITKKEFEKFKNEVNLKFEEIKKRLETK